MQSRNAACAQIRFYDCARNRLRHREETACRFRRARWCGCRARLRGWVGLRPRQAEEPSRFGLDIVEIIEVAGPTDNIEQVAMLAGGGIGLMFNCTYDGLCCG
ncbi:MAG: hypothetical protein AB7S46_17055, partial [Flavobacteriaceae bacterium]